MAKELNEDSAVKVSLKTLGGIAVLIFTLVGMWFTLQAEIQEAKLLLKAISAEKLTTTKTFFIPNVRLNSFGSLYGGLLGPVSLMPSSPGSEIKQLYPTTSLNFSLQWKIPIEKLIYNGPTKKMEASEQIKELEIKEIKAAIKQDIVTAKQNII